jgi:outer membrane receptor protein involved in Fe transport
MQSLVSFASFLFLILISSFLYAQGVAETLVRGRVLDPQQRAVPNAVVKATDGLGRVRFSTITNEEGRYALKVIGVGSFAFVADVAGFSPVTTDLRELKGESLELDLKLGELSKAETILTINERVVEPTVDQRDAAVFNKTLFTRDDQIFQTLGAGLNFGQHAGGGKSLEVRRFGFNLDHGGTGGGIRMNLDDMLVNQVSGGHAHGYLGALKGLSPEMVQSVDLINGPFNAAYGEFSGLGVVNIKTREEMPDTLYGRVQFGQFNTRRIFGAYSPSFGKTRVVIANEYSYSDGPFEQPLNYFRNNFTGSLFRTIRPGENFGFRLLGAVNDFYSAGQLPLDQIESGRLNRFGFIDPTEGGYSQSGTVTGYYTKDRPNGDRFQASGMVNRLLFDLYSNFTFFLNNPEDGDGFGQHDSRLQQQVNLSYNKPHQFGAQALGNLTGGFSYLGNQLNLGLYNQIARNPTELLTSANVRIDNPGYFVQENLTLANGKLQLGGGLRYDDFRFDTRNRIDISDRQNIRGGLWQPKASAAFTPWLGKPLTLHFNTGRAVTSTGARAFLVDPTSPVVASTDFYSFGTSHNKGRYSLATNFFRIDRSNEMIYVADDGSNEFVGPSRSYGVEVKSSIQLTRHLSWNGSITKIGNSYYRDTEPREYVDRAPFFTAYSALTLSPWHGWSGSVRFRAISGFKVNGEEGDYIRGPGYSLTDISVTRRINRWLEFNFAVDNIFDRQYYETINRFTSALRGQDPLERLHVTPGYPLTVVGGVNIRLFTKDR